MSVGDRGSYLLRSITTESTYATSIQTTRSEETLCGPTVELIRFYNAYMVIDMNSFDTIELSVVRPL